MFESDDWILEDAFIEDDIYKDTIQFRSQNEEKKPPLKRRKVENSKVPFSSINNTFYDSKLDIIKVTEDKSASKKNNLSQGDLLLGIFKKNTSQEILNFAKEMNKIPSSIQTETHCSQSSKMTAMSDIFQYKSELKENNHVKSMNKVEHDKEVKLIRIFPGPAGLVPKAKDDNISVISYLNSVKELENETIIKRIESKSQEERNSFGGKAWELLLEDLPNNFLKEYEISTIKDKANASYSDSIKVKFIAGVLDYVDYSHNDPFIVLKDPTGSIEGTIHRDILLNYPGVLEPNVVILLHDVGLLKTTTYIVMNKYHILASQINLLAIYSNKGRIVSTSYMENILSNISNIKLIKDYCKPISKRNAIFEMDKNNDNTILETSSPINISFGDYESKLINNTTSLSQLNKENGDCKQLLKRNNENYGEDTFKHNLNYSINIDMNDDFFTTDCEFITLGEQKCLNHLSSDYFTTLESSKIQQCKLQMKNTNNLENKKKESIINFQSTFKEKHLPQILHKCVTDVNISNTYNLHKSCPPSYNDIAFQVYKDSNSDIKFTSSIIKCNVENSKTLLSYFTDNKYDSDDEILSQLDVDNVLNNTKKEC